MRKIYVSIIGVFMALSAFGAGENVPTSKSYIDSALSQKQDTIERTSGNNQALTNTGVAGEYSTKEIYDSTGSYLGQTDALIDAVTMNTAVQNAIDSEFKCISWIDDDPTKDCLLMEIRGVTATGATTLPSGYTELEYIESTGTQYIDTGYKPNNLTNFEIKYLHTDWIQTTVNIPYGCTNSPDSSKANYCLFRTNRGTYTLNRMAWGNDRYGTNKALASEYQANLNEWYIDEYLQNQMYINGTLVATSAVDPGTVWNASRSIYLFKRNSPDPFPSKIRVAYVKIWEQNSLLHNMIPARRDSNGVLGMYDTVTNTFYTNAGTGEFIAGPMVNLYLPAGT